LPVTPGSSFEEWGGDVHVPAGDLSAAREARAASRERGIRVASYGPYFCAGSHGPLAFAPVLASAAALGAARIRIWAVNVIMATRSVVNWP
jgi:3-dehydroshikimate dehydratase